MHKSTMGRIIVVLVLLAVGALLAFFAIQNANRYWSPVIHRTGAELVPATVIEVDT